MAKSILERQQDFMEAKTKTHKRVCLMLPKKIAELLSTNAKKAKLPKAEYVTLLCTNVESLHTNDKANDSALCTNDDNREYGKGEYNLLQADFVAIKKQLATANNELKANTDKVADYEELQKLRRDDELNLDQLDSFRAKVATLEGKLLVKGGSDNKSLLADNDALQKEVTDLGKIIRGLKAEIKSIKGANERGVAATKAMIKPASTEGDYDGTTPLVDVLSALIGYGKGNDARHRDVNAKIKSDLKIISKAKRLKPAENLIRLRHVQDNLTEYRELFSNKK